MELIAQQGLETLPEALSALINEAMRIERERHLGAGPYERTEARNGYANGYKPRTLNTRMGVLDLRIPQVREGGFYPQSLDRGLRSERALKLALAQMYVEGVSTRKVARITVELVASRPAPRKSRAALRCWLGSHVRALVFIGGARPHRLPRGVWRQAAGVPGFIPKWR